MRAGHGGPLFVCHANCCRSVLAYYLYRHLCNNAPALSAGLEVGERINDRAERMLREWGIDASAHRPLKLSRDLKPNPFGWRDRQRSSGYSAVGWLARG